MSGSHGPSTHTRDCDCVRCTGFAPANTLSVRHGAYSTLHLGKRAAQLAAEIRDVAPVFEDADETAVGERCDMVRASRALMLPERAD